MIARQARTWAIFCCFSQVPWQGVWSQVEQARLESLPMRDTCIAFGDLNSYPIMPAPSSSNILNPPSLSPCMTTWMVFLSLPLVYVLWIKTCSHCAVSLVCSTGTPRLGLWVWLALQSGVIDHFSIQVWQGSLDSCSSLFPSDQDGSPQTSCITIFSPLIMYY